MNDNRSSQPSPDLLLGNLEWPADMAGEQLLFNRLLRSDPDTLAEWHRDGKLFENLTAMCDGMADRLLDRLVQGNGPLEAVFEASQIGSSENDE